MSKRAFALLSFVSMVASPCVGADFEMSPSTQELRARAVALEHGEGVAKDEMAAIELYCQAARAGDGEALFNLGWMFANGRGTQRDDAMAAFFFERAAQHGFEHAHRMRRFFGAPAETLPKCLELPPVATDQATESEPPEVEPALFVPRDIYQLVHRLAPEYKVDPRLALAVIKAESNFDPRARSLKNAQGLMQLIPETAERFNVRRPFDPEQNVRGGLAYLRWLLSHFRGQVPLVLAGYNAGEGAVDRYLGIPPFPETREYVGRIMRMFRSDTHPYQLGYSERTSSARVR